MENFRKNFSKEDISYVEDLFLDFGGEDSVTHVLATLSHPGMPSIKEVEEAVFNALMEVYDPEKGFWDQVHSLITKTPGSTWSGFYIIAYRAIDKFGFTMNDYMNILGWISGNNGYTDQNDYHPGYFKGVDKFLETIGEDPQNGSSEHFINGTDNIAGWWTGENKFNVSPLT